MTIYHLAVDCVDTVHSYCISTDKREEALEWLDKYDHEGSSLSLWVDKNGERDKKEYFGEDVYTRLLQREEQ